MCSLSYIYKLIWRDTVVHTLNKVELDKPIIVNNPICAKTLYKVESDHTLYKVESDHTLYKNKSNKLPIYMSYDEMKELCDIQDKHNNYGFHIIS
jgi:hypothetical protein